MPHESAGPSAYPCTGLLRNKLGRRTQPGSAPPSAQLLLGAVKDPWLAQRGVAPPEQICVPRSLWRQRGVLLLSQSRHMRHMRRMQNALTQMNMQLTKVLAIVAHAAGLR